MSDTTVAYSLVNSRRSTAVDAALRGLRVGVLVPLLFAAGCEPDAGPISGASNAEPSGSAADGATAGGETGSAPGIGAPLPLPVPAAAGSGQPHLAVGPAGEVVLSWLQPEGEGHVLLFSRLVDGEWSPATSVASGDDFFVNWADFPSVEPITGEVWAAHWLKRVPDTYASYDIAMAISTDGGASWGDGFVLNRDGVLTQHGFVSLFPWQEAIGAIWLDGRRPAELFEAGGLAPDAPPVGMSLRYARIGYDGEVLARGELDELVCDCCQTDVAIAAAGPVIVYRDRTPAEIRDITARRYAGGEWQEPLTLGPDNWHIEGCPVNGPAAAARGQEVVAAWFTAADEAPKVRFARSNDGGAGFGAPVEVDGAGAFGHVDVALLEDGAAAVSWWRGSASGGTELAVRRVEAEGTLGEVRVVTESDNAAPLDVPQMVQSDGQLIFAWTDAENSRVESASTPTH